MKGPAKRKPARASARGNDARGNPSRQKARPISQFDRFLRTLPLAEHEIQRIFTWIGLVTFLVIAFFVARFFGVGAFLHQQYAEQAARAGFVVTRVETTGMERVDQLKVYDIVLAEKDRAMPLVNVEKIRSDLMQYGWIKDVRVSRRLPDTLVVDITERKPAAIWNEQGRQNLIDEDGIILENIPVGSVAGLLMLSGGNANRKAPELKALIEAAPSLKPQISGASWVGNRRWDLQFKSGETIALPEGEKPAAKALVDFARMDGVSRLLGQDIIHFDLRDPDRAYLRKKPKEGSLLNITPETNGPKTDRPKTDKNGAESSEERDGKSAPKSDGAA